MFAVGLEIPLALLLMGLFALRAKVWPKAGVFVRATPEAVFKLIDMIDGRKEKFGQIQISTDLINPAEGIFRKIYLTQLSNGQEKRSEALFSIRERVNNQKLVIAREGLAGKSLNNELLSQTFEVVPEKDGTRLNVMYEWGSRPLLAQLVARADLWGGIFRIKSLAECGVPTEWPYFVITCLLSIVTAALSCAAFALYIGWVASALVIFALFVHELGHLISYRMMGQPWGRMIFLPFLGAIAMPRLAFDTQGQMVFAALMGPGFSLLLAAACLMGLYYFDSNNQAFIALGWITCALNIFNMLPAEPLDGGVALRSIMGRYLGKFARFGFIAIGLAMIGVGFFLSKYLLVAFGAVAVLLNLRRRTIDAGMVPLTNTQMVLTVLFYFNIIGMYVTLNEVFDPLFQLMQK